MTEIVTYKPRYQVVLLPVKIVRLADGSIDLTQRWQTLETEYDYIPLQSTVLNYTPANPATSNIGISFLRSLITFGVDVLSLEQHSQLLNAYWLYSNSNNFEGNFSIFRFYKKHELKFDVFSLLNQVSAMGVGIPTYNYRSSILCIIDTESKPD